MSILITFHAPQKSALLALLLVALAWSHVDAAKKDAVKKMAGLGVRKSVSYDIWCGVET